MSDRLAFAIFFIVFVQILSFYITNRHIDDVRDEIMGKRP